jgi:hypothetical protein
MDITLPIESIFSSFEEAYDMLKHHGIKHGYGFDSIKVGHINQSTRLTSITAVIVVETIYHNPQSGRLVHGQQAVLSA